MLRECDYCLPLHHACCNKSMSAKVVKMLVDGWPESVRQRNGYKGLPIHILCRSGMEDASALEILNQLINTYPESVREECNNSYLPIHLAACRMSPEFCKVLINAYPESLRVEAGLSMPIHWACSGGRLDMVKYLSGLYPERSNVRSSQDGLLPIHCASYFAKNTEIVEFLLMEDPDNASEASQNDRGNFPIHLACWSNRPASYKIVQMLFDAHPTNNPTAVHS